MRFARFSKELTKDAKFKDRRSKIGIRADGSQLVRLAGKDMEKLREKVFEESDGCWDRTFQSMGPNTCEGPLELSHFIPRGRGGSDVAENVTPRCRKHHRLYDAHGSRVIVKVNS